MSISVKPTGMGGQHQGESFELYIGVSADGRKVMCWVQEMPMADHPGYSPDDRWTLTPAALEHEAGKAVARG